MFRSMLRPSSGNGWLLYGVLAWKLLNSRGLYSSHTKHQFLFPSRRGRFYEQVPNFLHSQLGCSGNSPLHATYTRLHYRKAESVDEILHRVQTEKTDYKKYSCNRPTFLQSVTFRRHTHGHRCDNSVAIAANVSGNTRLLN